MTKTKTIVTGVLIFASGVGIGYGTAYVMQKKRYETLIDKEIAQVKDTYSDPSRKTGIFASPIDAVGALIAEDEETDEVNPAMVQSNSTLVAGRSRVTDILREEHYERSAEEYDGISRTGEPETSDEPTAYNLIEQAVKKSEAAIAELDLNKPVEQYAADLAVILGDDAPEPKGEGESIWDPETMAKHEKDAQESMPEPTPDRPYVITHDQYMTDDVLKENKVSVIYFEDDGQLADESGHLVNSVEALVGRENLERFGLGSQDRNIVYIRNEKMDIDIEVVRDKRCFQNVILGVREPKTSSEPLRMRDDDH